MNEIEEEASGEDPVLLAQAGEDAESTGTTLTSLPTDVLIHISSHIRRPWHLLLFLSSCKTLRSIGVADALAAYSWQQRRALGSGTHFDDIRKASIQFSTRHPTLWALPPSIGWPLPGGTLSTSSYIYTHPYDADEDSGDSPGSGGDAVQPYWGTAFLNRMSRRPDAASIARNIMYRAAADGAALAQLGPKRDTSHGGHGTITPDAAAVTLSRMRSLTLGRAAQPAPSAPRPYEHLWRECCPRPGQNRGRPYLMHWILGHLVAAMGGAEGVHDATHHPVSGPCEVTMGPGPRPPPPPRRADAGVARSGARHHGLQRPSAAWEDPCAHVNSARAAQGGPRTSSSGGGDGVQGSTRGMGSSSDLTAARDARAALLQDLVQLLASCPHGPYLSPFDQDHLASLTAGLTGTGNNQQGVAFGSESDTAAAGVAGMAGSATDRAPLKVMPLTVYLDPPGAWQESLAAEYAEATQFALLCAVDARCEEATRALMAHGLPLPAPRRAQETDQSLRALPPLSRDAGSSALPRTGGTSTSGGDSSGPWSVLRPGTSSTSSGWEDPLEFEAWCLTPKALGEALLRAVASGSEGVVRALLPPPDKAPSTTTAPTQDTEQHTGPRSLSDQTASASTAAGATSSAATGVPAAGTPAGLNASGSVAPSLASLIRPVWPYQHHPSLRGLARLQGGRPLQRAAEEGHGHLVRMLATEFDDTVTDLALQDAMHAAVEHGHAGAVRALLEVGLLPQEGTGAAGGEREAQLMVWLGQAARKGHDEVFDTLLPLVDLTHPVPEEVVTLIVHANKPAVLTRLVKAGFKMSSCTHSLAEALALGRISCARALIEAGVDPRIAVSNLHTIKSLNKATLDLLESCHVHLHMPHRQLPHAAVAADAAAAARRRGSF